MFKKIILSKIILAAVFVLPFYFFINKAFALPTSGMVGSTVEINDSTTNGPILTNGDGFGFSVANIGDLNNDGVEDLAVGAVYDDNGGTDRGAIHILFMNTDGSVDSTVEINDSTTNGPVLTNNEAYYGGSVAGLGDLNGDGVEDLAVGAYLENSGGNKVGAVYVSFMNTDGSVDSTVAINNSTPNGPTLTDTDFFGTSVANIGDLNNDGVEDLAVGARNDDNSGLNRGAIHILFMNTDGSVDSTVEINDSTTNGPVLSDSDLFGSSVADVGDLNEDGVNDIAVGAFFDDDSGTNRGTLHILFMNTDGSVDSTVEINDSTTNGPTLGDEDRFGFRVSGIGDLNNDNVLDIVVSAPLSDVDGTDKGTVNIFYLEGQPYVTLDTSSLTIGENGDSDTFAVTLSRQPTTDVVLNVVSSSTSEATVSPSTLTFTNSNWSTPQDVTVTGVNDSIVTTDTATITVSVNTVSSDDEFDSMANQTVSVTLTNDDLTASGGIFYHILSTGQSLSIGARGYSPLSTTQPYSNYSLTYDATLTGSAEGPMGTKSPLIPLIENREELGADVETISSGLANSLSAYDDPVTPDRKFVIGLHGKGSSGYSVIKKGGSDYPYANGQIQATNTKTAVEQTFSGEYRPLAVTLIHGETDASVGNGIGNPAPYEASLDELQLNYESDLNTLTGRSDRIPLFISQMNALKPDQIAVAQYRASENNNDIYLVGPSYQYAFYSDDIHLTAIGYRVLGEQFAKVMDKVLFESEEWKPLSPKVVAKSGSEVYVYYHVPVSPIVFDTTTVVQRADGNYGFEFTETGGSGTDISSVSIVKDDVIKISLDSTPSGSTPRIKYAAQTLVGNSGGPETSTFSGGNVRDSDSSTSPSSDSSGVPLYNWGTSYDEEIINDTTDPVVTITAPTKSSASNITNTTIRITDDVALFSDDISVDVGSTASTSSFSCSQTSVTQVDCTITITSSGDLIIDADDMVGNTGSDSETGYYIGVIDVTPPVLSNGLPTGEQPSGTTSVNLQVLTDENSTCKYGTTSGIVYGSIPNTFSTTGTTSHSQTITGLVNNTSYTYYIRCTDISSNINTSDYTVSFSVAPVSVVPSSPTSTTSSGSYASPLYIKTLGLSLNPINPIINSENNKCSQDKQLTQNLRTGARNGVYEKYTGSIVKDAKLLQYHLNRLGFNSGPEDGILGPISDGAIKRMQTYLGTLADGYVGPITRGLINKSCEDKI